MEIKTKEKFDININIDNKFQIPLEEIILISPEEVEKIINEIKDNNSTKILNINVGILGHVDSGKTSLSKMISSISSTASFDKNPQSKERGITLDLGFSALYIQTPKLLKQFFHNNKKIVESEYIQITLVDCPGHASLIRTIISGASIIDTVILVIDSVKGIQIQTVECIALSEILCEKITIALSKVDLLKNKEEDIPKKTEKLRQIFAKTKFGNDIPIIPTTTLDEDKNNIQKTIKLLIKNVIECIDFNSNEDDINNKSDSLIAYIDHCFKVKNKGTVATGTIMKGNLKINDEIFFPELSNKYMVKEIQIFRKSVKSATKGDRVGLLIKNLDNQKVERTIITSVGSKEVNYLEGGILLLKKVKLYKDKLKSNNKYYLMIGNQGISAKCLFFNYINKKEELFSKYDINNIKKTEICDKNIFYSKEYSYLEQIDVNENNEYYFSFVKFDKKIIVPNKMIFLGTNIDIDISENKKDRLAFYGKIIISNSDINEVIKNLKIAKNKMKEGRIIRVIPEDKKICIVRGFIKKENIGNINNLIGKEIYGRIEKEGKDEIKEEKEDDKKLVGKILSSFGQVGKLKVEFNQEIDVKIFKNIILEMPIKKYVKLDKI
jgi:selenocysteine-specific elongation factor